MTIHELANSSHAELIELPYNLSGMGDLFPLDKTDFLAGDSGELFIAINRQIGRFAAQGGGNRVVGHVDSDIPARVFDKLRRRVG